jgi:hypothetical protein
VSIHPCLARLSSSSLSVKYLCPVRERIRAVCSSYNVKNVNEGSPSIAGGEFQDFLASSAQIRIGTRDLAGRCPLAAPPPLSASVASPAHTAIPADRQAINTLNIEGTYRSKGYIGFITGCPGRGEKNSGVPRPVFLPVAAAIVREWRDPIVALLTLVRQECPVAFLTAGRHRRPTVV